MFSFFSKAYCLSINIHRVDKICIRDMRLMMVSAYWEKSCLGSNQFYSKFGAIVFSQFGKES